jgi:hypothetical protein
MDIEKEVERRVRDRLAADKRCVSTFLRAYATGHPDHFGVTWAILCAWEQREVGCAKTKKKIRNH